MGTKYANHLAGLEIPNTQFTIMRTRYKSAATWQHRYRIDIVGVSCKRTRLAGLQIPNTKRFVI
jgi:hypothetical protein